MARTLGEGGLALLRQWEQGPDGGPALKPYRDTAGNWTIGYGHLMTHQETLDIADGGVILLSPEDAAVLLHHDIAPREITVNRLVKSPLSQNQFDALVCFVFNVGVSNFASSTLLLNLNEAGNYDDVPAQLRRWDKACDQKTGLLVESHGLLHRREAEIALWLTPDAP